MLPFTWQPAPARTSTRSPYASSPLRTRAPDQVQEIGAMRFLLLALVGVLTRQVSAQTTPGIGRLPLLADLPTSGGACKVANTDSTLQRSGMVRMFMWSGDEPERLISVTTDSGGRPRSLYVLSSVKAGPKRREGESISAFLDAAGRVVRGDRSYYTLGVPARMSEDRHSGLLPRDSIQVSRLARAVLARCRR